MGKSILTRAGSLFKSITGVQDISSLRKDIKKNVGKIVYHKKYDADELVMLMQQMGMKAGSVVCIHAAMKEFYNYQGDAKQLIDKILEIITPEGTLIMPALPDYRLRNNPDYIFDPEHEKTIAGHLAELFRHYPGVCRSISVQSSACALGKHAEWLTKDHHLGRNCWDEFSPWYRMTQLGCLVFCLGLPSSYIGTFDHCVEAVLYKEHPYWAQFFPEERTFRYIDADGTVQQYTNLLCTIERRTHEHNLINRLEGNIFRTTRLSNLLVKVFESDKCLPQMIDMGRKGITMYYVPSPKKFTF